MLHVFGNMPVIVAVATGNETQRHITGGACFYAWTRKSTRTHEKPKPVGRLYAVTFSGSLYIYTEKQHICMLDISLAIRNASHQNNRLQLTDYLHDKREAGTVLQRGLSLATVGCGQDMPAPIGSSEL